MNNHQKKNWWIDAGLFIGLIISFYINLTGVGLHQWIGVFGGGLAAYHLFTHWNWVKAVSLRFFGRSSGKVRGFYLIDAVLFAGMMMIVFTGLLISPWFSLSLSNSTGWLRVHIIASIVTLVVVVWKLALHWRWIVSATSSIFAEPVQPPRIPVAVPARGRARQISRGEFLGVMGVVGLSSLLALTSASANLKTLQTLENSSSVQEDGSPSSSNSVAVSSFSSSSPSSASCMVRCNHRCSYPGNCRKYTDSNDNGYCDLGECA